MCVLSRQILWNIWNAWENYSILFEYCGYRASYGNWWAETNLYVLHILVTYFQFCYVFRHITRAFIWDFMLLLSELFQMACLQQTNGFIVMHLYTF
jgi:hypothetical protein